MSIRTQGQIQPGSRATGMTQGNQGTQKTQDSQPKHGNQGNQDHDNPDQRDRNLINSIPTGLPSWLHWLDSCPSTNTWALEQGGDLPHGTVIFTRHQTAGRGQHNRVWASPPGVITASVLLDRLSPRQLSGFSLVVGLAVIYGVEAAIPQLTGRCQLKWPNDVLVCDRKLAGILCETTPGPTGCRVVVGVGLNHRAEFTETPQITETTPLGRPPISLHHLVPAVPSDLALLTQIRHWLLQAGDVARRCPDAAPLQPFVPALTQRDALYGRLVTLTQAEQAVTGIVQGIDDQGRLLIRLSTGQLQRFSVGRVSWG
jgi:BirA family biotin operon repressor/biotin-[acetyl-CoA-carboxylase] ligase